MRNLIDVNAHRTAYKEHKTHAPAIDLQSDLQDGEQPAKTPWWKRYFRWEHLTMSDGKTIDKGFVITPAMSLFLAGVFISVLAYGYKSSTADNRETRDAVIRMETMLNERTTTFKERQAEMMDKLDNEIKIGEIRRERDTERNSKMVAALRQKGIIIDD